MIASKLSNEKTKTKVYWSILKIFYIVEKILVIPPLLTNNELISEFKMKANHFNSFFAPQCTWLDNNSKVPGSQTSIIDSNLSSLQFEDKDIIKTIRSLISIKICDFAEDS